jgi:hypothetical protein
MSTQFYHVTIEKLDDPTTVELTLRVTDAASCPLQTPPANASWALRTLHETQGSALQKKLTIDDVTNDAWIKKHAGEYISKVVVLEQHAFPLGGDEFAYNDIVESEGIMGPSVARARYAITVSEAKWLEGIEPGSAWDSCAYP